MSDVVVNFCWIGIHSWSEWADADNKECGSFQVQTCGHCKKKRYTSVVVGHKWAKWDSGNITNVFTKGSTEANGDYPIHKLLVQRRVCTKCGQIDARQTKI